ncbi:hypothetical protein D9758_000407 [Tetrapyrgos nigripes]|uniref:Uncharacterized protein n=1 Tax=Tetrapyrgos nigripes TaxID=182062 RepID=A0A8H5H0Y8_9AGAR|nr:hypothetical protein D9758_000407 [Tetrapyrgos nigripes]
MLRSPGSPVDDSHISRLLDQRATRADLHSRVSDDYPDTPSLYSHAFSPRSHVRADLDDVSSFHGSPPSFHGSSYSRPGDPLNDLAVSMLDMDEDPRASYASTSYDEDDDRNTIETIQEGVESTTSRISYLGPKMRFHSKAPWELQDSPFPEEEEDWESSADQRSVMTSALQSIGIKPRRLVFGSSKPGNEGRRSGESSRSGGTEKTSFDSVSQPPYPQTSFYDSAQRSLSSVSLNSQSGSRKPFTHVHSHYQPPSSPVPPPNPHYATFEYPDNVYSLRQGSSVDDSGSRPLFGFSVEETHHPYANPGHARLSMHDMDHSGFLRSSESSATVTGSQKNISLPLAQSPSRQISVDTSMISSPQSPRLPVHAKEISSPISIRNVALRSHEMSESSGDISSAPPPQLTSISGWTERAASPAFNLISLEEARAQRARAATMCPTPTAAVSTLPFPEGPGAGHVTAPRIRSRSISAGAKAKQALSSIVSGNTPSKPDRRESESSPGPGLANSPAAGKSLRHKKSGFMRLFNGRDEPPPVPSLSEGYTAFNAQQSVSRNPISSHRIPVPQISPSLVEEKQFGEPISAKPVPSPKRTPPPLQLTASAYTPGSLRPQAPDVLIQSAPANVTEFPALKLRPISTMFSTHFSDHILSSPPTSSADDLETPSSLAASTPPVTPATFLKPENNDSKTSTDDLTVDSTADSATIIKSLKEQIVNSRRAWHQQVWELEGQIRDLKVEVRELRSSSTKDGLLCEHCGMHSGRTFSMEQKPISVVNRPRARTGTGVNRFGSKV